MSEPWFLLSYARGDDSQAHVRTLFEKLCSYLGRRLAIGTSEVGFLDRFDVPLGARWGSELERALARCRVFVPIVSPNYCKSDVCGREWSYFERRCETTGQGQLSAVVPILWITAPEPLPPFVKELQYVPPLERIDSRAAELIERTYERRGLEWMAVRSGPDYENAMHTMVELIGDRIIELGKCNPPPNVPTSLRLETVTSRFATHSTPPEAFRSGMPAPRRALFFTVAGRRDEVVAVHAGAEWGYSDSHREDWTPFKQTPEQSIGVIAQRAASGLSMMAVPLDVQNGWVEKIRDAENEHHPAVVIVDPWSTRLSPYAQHLEDLDRSQFRNCAVLVVWSDFIEPDAVQREHLEQDIATALSRRRVGYRSTPLLNESVCSESELYEAVVASLREIDLLLAPLRRAVRAAAPSMFPTRPGLSAA